MGKYKSLKLNTLLVHLSILFLSTLILGIFCLTIGSVDTSISDIYRVIFTGDSSAQISQIVLQIRLPRILYAILIGGGLSVAGAVFQAILMNPLAEPYILGISSGGTFGAVLSFVIGATFLGTQIMAFSGAFLVMLLVFFLGKRYGDLEPNTLLLSGVMIGAFFSAAILLMVIFLNDSLRTAVYWMVGSLTFAKLENLWLVSTITIVVFIYLVINSHKYNILALGGETAKSLGINSNTLKKTTYFAASLLIGAVVSVSGIIGFVGLVVPHVCRLIWGVDNRIIIPSSFFIGAMYLTVADSIARTIISPSELPVGAITAILGAPIFIYLLKTRFSLN
ncbi:MAG: iron ABC transporter permease [Melioribacteraceae bacterium]|nr:iron ABC transporter permease [Melioribacteraceae bacterium]